MELLESSFQEILKRIVKIKTSEYHTILSESPSQDWNSEIDQIINSVLSSKNQTEFIDRVRLEIFDLGPLVDLIASSEVTEILVNSPSEIWFEKNGKMHKHHDQFISKHSYTSIFDRICDEAKTHFNKRHPFIETQFRNFRLSAIGQDITQSHFQYSLRRHPENPWTLDSLMESGWAEPQKIEILKSFVKNKKNFLVIGGTGCGKTSVCNALLQTLPENERVVILEDTAELKSPNKVSSKFLTRKDPNDELPFIDLGILVQKALRFRPDRVVLGEIRGPEAKDLLMAFATGHRGSFATMHADDPAQAMIRLEMLIQLGAPQWSLEAVRRLIQLSLDGIVVTKKAVDGRRQLVGIYKISSLESSGFIVESLESPLRSDL